MTLRPYGTDRLTTSEDGTVFLACRHPKEGWVARRNADNVHREFPGTCVRWGSDFYEVLSIDELPVGVRYGLGPWSDSHTMRTVLDYDEPSESHRDKERAAEQSRRKRAAGFSVFSVVTGLLPADVQLEQERELGVSAYLASLVSLAIPFFVGGASMIFFVASAMGGNPTSLPRWVYLIGIYFWLETMIRLGVVLGQSSPIGSFPVVLGWEIVAALRGKRPLRAPAPKLRWELDQATLDRDVFTQWEPFLSLLSPAEQHLLAARYGFDWTARGTRSAWVIMVFASVAAAFAAADIFSGQAGIGDVVTVFVMGYLIWEQIIRLQRIKRGVPAGSALGAVVRPMVRKLELGPMA